ncbi:MAG: PEGA domain-containing protein [Deltaproteobacteria bacterium]|jgi:hypothetical protein|nr:PEGA domain-containing protein [Deltaproteobacteria bacterium]MBW2529958.1 PEGA domain-containing protein [Deltaproteobacteria bacterium]
MAEVARQRFWLAWVLAVVLGGSWVVVWAAPAHAQVPGGDGAAPPTASEPAAGQPAGAEEAPGKETRSDAYRRHLDNGVRLFKDENYRAAITEFEAAYRAEPKASPLVNIALSYKALHDYPKAIQALDRVITQHSDSIEPEHLDAAKREITQLRQLLAYLTVRVEPAQAELSIDGQKQPATALGKPIALSPGPHVLTAELAGYQPAEQKVTLTSGEHQQDLVLQLVPLGGQLQVVVRDRDVWVQVDAYPPGQGGWQGTLAPGTHAVSTFRQGGDDRRTLQVRIEAGKSHLVTQDETGELTSDAAVGGSATDGQEEDDGEPRRGFFFTGHAALLGIVGPHPDGFTRSDKPAGGGGIGARIGYRFANWGAFEGQGQLTSVAAAGDLSFAHDSANTYFETQYTLQSLRLGGGFRVLLPGRSLARFVGVAAGGMTIERLVWEDGDYRATGSTGTTPGISQAPFGGSDGIGAFGQLELGVEFEVSNVLLGMLVRNGVQTTSHLDAADGNPWDGKPIWLVGLSAHVGYGIW